MNRLTHKVAYITGGARGMGAEFARLFASEGADIVILDICENIDTVRYDMGTREQIDAVAEEVRALGRRCIAEVADVRDQSQLDAVTAKALDQFGQIDIVCANAGIHHVAPFWKMTEDEWNNLLSINLTGIWKTAKSTAPSMMDRESGCFIITSSVSGREPLPDYAHYTSAKHGVIGLARSLGVELGPHNVRVNTLLPGPIDTYLNDNPINRDWAAGFEGATTDDMHAAIRHWHNLKGRGALPARAVANAALFLASDESEHIHGAELAVDAGHGLLAGFNHSPSQPVGYPRRPNEGYNPYAR